VVYVDTVNSNESNSNDSISNESNCITKEDEEEKKLREQISGKVKNRVKQIVSQYGIDCDVNKTNAIQTLCSLCQVQFFNP